MRNFQRQLHRSDVSEELDDCKAACEGRAPRPSQIEINTLHFARPVSTSSRSVSWSDGDDDEDVKDDDDETMGVMMRPDTANRRLPNPDGGCLRYCPRAYHRTA